MARRPVAPRSEQEPVSLSSSIDDLLLAAFERGEEG